MKTCIILCSAFFVLLGCITFLSAPALALERMVPDDPSAVVSTDGKMASAPAAKARADEDTCFALLKTNSGEGTDFSAPAPAPDSAPAAAIGFVFGIRFALGPKQKAAGPQRPTFAVWQTGGQNDGRALAIAGYRHCRNEQALKQMNR